MADSRRQAQVKRIKGLEIIHLTVRSLDVFDEIDAAAGDAEFVRRNELFIDTNGALGVTWSGLFLPSIIDSSIIFQSNMRGLWSGFSVILALSYCIIRVVINLCWSGCLSVFASVC